MEKRYYNAESIARALHAYEERFGMDSRDFYEAHCVDGEAVAEIPGFVRHVWAGLYRDFRRLSGEDFVERIETVAEFV